jgi:hypothetical protein
VFCADEDYSRLELPVYQREEHPTIHAFYKLYAEFMDEIPGDMRQFVERMASMTGLPREGKNYPTDSDSLRSTAVCFVDAAGDVFQFPLHLDGDDANQLDRFAEKHLIDPDLRHFFGTNRRSHLSEAETNEYCAAAKRLRVPNEPLLYYAMGAFWGEWRVRHRQACWALYAPLNPLQAFPDMITQGATICSHPFSQVCKKLSDPEGDNLAYKAFVSTGQKRYLPPYPLLTSLADAEHAVRQLLPEPARRALDAEKAGNDQQAWELFCEAAMEEEQPQLLSMMIACAWRLNKYDMVDGVSRRLLNLVPGHPVTCHNLAVLYSHQPNMMDQAIELLQQAVQSDPRYSRAHITLASCLSDLGRKDEARQHAEWVRDNDRDLTPEAEKLLAGLRPKRWFSKWFKN